MYVAREEIKIQGIVEKIDIFIVEDSVIKYPLLIGHSFTERPGIIIIKTTESLKITKSPSVKLELILQHDVSVSPQQLIVIPVTCSSNYSGSAYITGR